MFEDVEEFSFEEEDMCLYCDSVEEFNLLSFLFNSSEVGISFKGNVQVDDGMSIITDTKVQLDTPEETKSTYLKVMEMRELTESERTQVAKYKVFLKKIFEVFFRNEKWRVYYTLFFSAWITFDLCIHNYLGALIIAMCVAMNTSPIKFYKELRKMFGKKRKKELNEELSKLNLLGLVNSVDEDKGVQLYLKPKNFNM